MGSPVLNAVSQGVRLKTAHTPAEGEGDDDFAFADLLGVDLVANSEAEYDDVRTEVRYSTNTIGGEQPAGSAAGYVFVLTAVIVVLFLVVVGLCCYNKHAIAKRELIADAIHIEHPGEMVGGKRGFNLEQ